MTSSPPSTTRGFSLTTRGGWSSERRSGGTTGAVSAPACWRSVTPSDRGGTASGSAMSAVGRGPPTPHTPATSAGNATRCPLQRRQAPTGAHSAPRWPRAPGPNLPRARTGARRRRLCTGASGEHTPPHTNARAPRAPPSCGSACTCGTPRPLRTCRTCPRPDPHPPPHSAEPAAPYLADGGMHSTAHGTTQMHQEVVERAHLPARMPTRIRVMLDSDGSPQRDDRHHRRSRSCSPVSPEWAGETLAEREERRLATTRTGGQRRGGWKGTQGQGQGGRGPLRDRQDRAWQPEGEGGATGGGRGAGRPRSRTCSRCGASPPASNKCQRTTPTTTTPPRSPLQHRPQRRRTHLLPAPTSPAPASAPRAEGGAGADGLGRGGTGRGAGAAGTGAAGGAGARGSTGPALGPGLGHGPGPSGG